MSFSSPSASSAARLSRNSGTVSIARQSFITDSPSFGNSFGFDRSAEAEAYAAARVGRRFTEPNSGRAVPRRIVPAPAAVDALPATRSLSPLPHVTIHVIQAKSIWRLQTYWMCLLARIAIKPRGSAKCFLRHFSSIRTFAVLSCRARTSCIFPFICRREAENQPR